MSKRSCRTIGLMLLLPACVYASHAVGADEDTLPDYSDVQQAIDAAVASMAEIRPAALISRREGEVIFDRLADIGWTVADKSEILKSLLPSNAPLVVTLRSQRGRGFASQVAGYKLIYDRLDRISQEPGGQRLLQDLVKLPDAARYAKQATSPGVPDLVGLLPKQRSGKTRQVKDYDKPTKKIYTLDQLVKRIHQSYDREQNELQP